VLRSGWDNLDGLFEVSDILINLLPSTDETRGLIDERRLALLPQGAGFINVGRGDIVEQATLLHFLDAGQLSLASLDVLSTEPPIAADPVWTHPRVFLTPHIASRSYSPGHDFRLSPAARDAAGMRGRSARNAVDRYCDVGAALEGRAGLGVRGSAPSIRSVA